MLTCTAGSQWTGEYHACPHANNLKLQLLMSMKTQDEAFILSQSIVFCSLCSHVVLEVMLIRMVMLGAARRHWAAHKRLYAAWASMCAHIRKLPPYSGGPFTLAHALQSLVDPSNGVCPICTSIYFSLLSCAGQACCPGHVLPQVNDVGLQVSHGPILLRMSLEDMRMAVACCFA